MNFYELSQVIDTNEAFGQQFKQGFQQSYQQQRAQKPDEQGAQQDFSKFSSVAGPALKKAHGAAQQMSQKTGVPLPLATALIASGIVGGPAAIPMAALLYFVRKPLMQGASKVFDAGASMVGAQPQQAQNPQQAGWSDQNKAQWQQARTESFKAYCQYREGFGDWAGKKMGQASGFMAGKGVNTGSRVGSLMKNSVAAIGQFAKENKLAVSKAIFLMGVGAVIGTGVGMTTNGLGEIFSGMETAGIPAEEIQGLQQTVGGGDAQGATFQSGGSSWNSQLGKSTPVDLPDGGVGLQTADGSIYKNMGLGKVSGDNQWAKQDIAPATSGAFRGGGDIADDFGGGSPPQGEISSQMQGQLTKFNGELRKRFANGEIDGQMYGQLKNAARQGLIPTDIDSLDQFIKTKQAQ